MTTSEQDGEIAQIEFNGLTHQCSDPECHVAGFVKTLRQKAQGITPMDRPAYELVRSPNGPSGRCAEHGPYLYYCPTCHEKWRDEHPELVAKIAARASTHMA